MLDHAVDVNRRQAEHVGHYFLGQRHVEPAIAAHEPGEGEPLMQLEQEVSQSLMRVEPAEASDLREQVGPFERVVEGVDARQ